MPGRMESAYGTPCVGTIGRSDSAIALKTPLPFRGCSPLMRSQQGNWIAGTILVSIHLGALGALWPAFFQWQALVVMGLLIYVTDRIGVALGFHRTLMHGSVRLWKPLECAVTLCGYLALQGSPIDWVVTHRIDHAHTDREGDPHDANAGFRWSHFLWMVMPTPNFALGDDRRRYAPDLFAQPFYRFLHQYYLGLTVVLALAQFALGGWSWVVWGIFVRLALVYQFTWLVNRAHTPWDIARSARKIARLG